MISKSKQIFLSIFKYRTPEFVVINNWKVGLLKRLVQLAIISYIIGYAIVWNKGYQDFSTIDSSVTTKVKGVVFTNFTEKQFNSLIPDSAVYRRIWDTADYILPISENNAFFVVTNVVITSNQTQNTCSEDPEIPGSLCKTDKDCIQGASLLSGNGILTGKCVQSDINNILKVCQIQGWCPVERNVNPLKDGKALLTATKKFTVLIKNYVDFPKFNIRRRNIPDFKNSNYLMQCTYHPDNDPLCPVFVLEDIVPEDYDKIAVKGATVAIIIHWECNFDFKASKCFPKYKFRRIDEENSPISPGLNFRYGHYYSDSVRTLYKAYGIKFVVMTQGRGGKFSIVPLLLYVGAALGLLRVATILCDIAVLCFVKKTDIDKSKKYQSAVEDNANTVSHLLRCQTN